MRADDVHIDIHVHISNINIYKFFGELHISIISCYKRAELMRVQSCPQKDCKSCALRWFRASGT